MAGKRIAAMGYEAVAYAVREADVDVVPVYPITPQTNIAEKIAELIANGELDAEMIHVESEHSAMSAAVAASAAGARVFTATASQGLELMHEVLWIASSLRVPVVMALCTRALNLPLSIWNDYSDAMSMRETGWIMLFSESVQEAYDHVIVSYRIAEDPNVLLPVVTVLDGFTLTHTVEPLELLPQEEVAKFIPKRPWGYRHVLDPDNPVTMGPVAPPAYYYEIKYQQIMAMRSAYPHIENAFKEYCKMFGRCFDFIEEYMLDDAEYVLITFGAMSTTAKAAVNRLRREGFKAGLLRVRVYRPWPAERIVKALEKIPNLKAIGVLDRFAAMGAATEGPLHGDVVITLAKKGMLNVPVASFIHGLGGRDIFTADIMRMYKMLEDFARKGRAPEESIHVGVRQ